MNIYYRVRVKLSAPNLKSRFSDGIYVATDIVSDPDSVKKYIEQRFRQELELINIRNVTSEVVIFRRSDIGFILSEKSKDLENKK